ncbi:4-hydroxythreonine-4-phosphate dehydrogenase PdxA [Mesorhizobium sp. ZMM04-5]|uniref:4-hydroxythreonine-4-phosphate dehydrogenase n=1 Tax=Mesorhizobium marinum TaxID=3228790 RepID=A0ABV3R5Z9_9HYPH
MTDTSAAAPPLALTMGEPAGIGGEVAVKAWQALAASGPAFFLLDDPARIAALAGPGIRIAEIAAPAEATALFGSALPVLPVPLAVPVQPGRPDPANAAAVIRSITMAVQLTQAGQASAVVTNPIQKATLYEAGFPHPGHTEFLGALVGSTAEPVMMLASPMLRVVPVSIHVSLRTAIETLTSDLIVERSLIAHRALCTDFGIANPRLAVAGLNPHAGEGGAMGVEDDMIVAPAIRTLREAGVAASGPYPPDTMFTPRARAGYDAAICMYHDQALIPLKTIDMDGGVNVTLGLPVVRTSPDHGTALDIAGKGSADQGSLIAALRLAAELAARRASAAQH